MSELAADGVPVAVTCRVLQIARQPYYRWLARPVTPAELTQAYRANALVDAHREDPEFGYRFLLAKHFTPLIAVGGSLLFFSGLAAWRPSPGGVAMAATNGGVTTMVSALAVELAPIRVNAISPGVIATSAWDAVGPGKQAFFDKVAVTTPARRVGAPSDISAAARALLTNPFITGETLHVDGGGRWA